MVSVIRMATTYTARPLLARCLTSAQGASPILGMPPSDLACPARSALAKAGVAGGGIQAPATQGGREPNIADAPDGEADEEAHAGESGVVSVAHNGTRPEDKRRP